MVISAIIRKELIRTRFVLARTRTSLHSSIVLVPENLESRVVVVELGQIRRQMRNQIFIMNYPVYIVYFVVYVLRKLNVSNSRRPIRMHLNFITKTTTKLNSRNHSQRPSQRVTSR